LQGKFGIVSKFAEIAGGWPGTGTIKASTSLLTNQHSITTTQQTTTRRNQPQGQPTTATPSTSIPTATTTTTRMADERMVVLTAGQQINGRWDITKKLGAGAFGAVYLCKSTQEGFAAALKTEPLDANPPLLAMEVGFKIDFSYF
jgi:hypothetical protein